MRLVQIEVPWIGLGCAVTANKYLRACIRDALSRDEIPWSRDAMLFLTNSLYQADEDQLQEAQDVARKMCLHADLTVFYIDKGMSAQMTEIHRWCLMRGKTIAKRTIY